MLKRSDVVHDFVSDYPISRQLLEPQLHATASQQLARQRIHLLILPSCQITLRAHNASPLAHRRSAEECATPPSIPPHAGSSRIPPFC